MPAQPLVSGPGRLLSTGQAGNSDLPVYLYVNGVQTWAIACGNGCKSQGQEVLESCEVNESPKTKQTHCLPSQCVVSARHSETQPSCSFVHRAQLWWLPPKHPTTPQLHVMCAPMSCKEDTVSPNSEISPDLGLPAFRTEQNKGHCLRHIDTWTLAILLQQPKQNKARALIFP